MLAFEMAVSLLILGRGRYVKLGLSGAILFLLGITPLGTEELPNVILAAGMAVLMTHQFPTDVLTMLRNRRRSRMVETSCDQSGYSRRSRRDRDGRRRAEGQDPMSKADPFKAVCGGRRLRCPAKETRTRWLTSSLVPFQRGLSHPGASGAPSQT